MDDFDFLMMQNNRRVYAAAAVGPVELFPFPDLVGSTWTAGNWLFNAGSGTLDPDNSGGTTSLVTGRNELHAAVPDGGSLTVTLTAESVASGGNIGINVKGGPTAVVEVDSDGTYQVLVTAGSVAIGVSTFRLTDQDGASLTITDISVVAA
jgi:hypothetical protein